MTSVFIFVSKLETDICKSADVTFTVMTKNVGQKILILCPLLSH